MSGCVNHEFSWTLLDIGDDGSARLHEYHSGIECVQFGHEWCEWFMFSMFSFARYCKRCEKMEFRPAEPGIVMGQHE